jgi:serine/threonine protein phosphatase PrpC
MTNVDVAAISDTGRVREANEDSFLVDLDLFIFAVADGMGGHVAGEIASATAIESIRAATASGIDIETAILKAHDAVKKKAAGHEELAGMGTTLTALGFSADKKLVVAHVGDSRAYVLHRNHLGPSENDELVRITKDHSLVEELVDAGQITEEEANVHPRRSVITRALGIEGKIEVDTTDIAFLKNDRYLLCSDGLTSMVRDDDILDILKGFDSPNECARELVSRANQAGGADNITVVIIDVIDENVHEPVHAAAATSVAAEEAKVAHNKQGRVMFVLCILFVVALFGAILFGAFKTAEHFATQGYFLDEKKGEVVLMAGREGGVLWWDAELNTQTGLDVNNLTSADKLLVARHIRFESRDEALKLLAKMRLRQVETPTIIPDSSTTTTTPTAISAPITVTEGTSVSSNE